MSVTPERWAIQATDRPAIVATERHSGPGWPGALTTGTLETALTAGAPLLPVVAGLDELPGCRAPPALAWPPQPPNAHASSATNNGAGDSFTDAISPSCVSAT
jgi:hypothetical protein